MIITRIVSYVYDNTRYLDVYIGNSPTGLVMTGAVIFRTTEALADDAGQDSITTTTVKTTGFAPQVADTGTPDYTNDASVDRYWTYDFTVKKTITGTMADKLHEFPLYVTVANTIAGAAFTYTKDASETFTNATQDGTTLTKYTVAADKTGFSVGADSKTTSDLKLKDGDQITFTGVPSSQASDLSVTIKEFNDTVDEYTASLAATSATDPTIAKTNGETTDTSGTMTATTGTVETAAFNLKGNDIAAQIIEITNNLAEISPTGYVQRFAPYALLMGCGVALVPVIRRRREDEDEA